MKINKKILTALVSVIVIFLALFKPVYNHVTDKNTNVSEYDGQSVSAEIESIKESVSEEYETQTEESSATTTAYTGRTEKTTRSQTTKTTRAQTTKTTTAISDKLDINGSYYSKDDVALYIHTYGKLPSNFITKSKAQSLGWSGGSVEDYAPGKAIGGDRFGNYEGLLPEKSGRTYYECDIDTNGKSSRGAKRIIYSNDGLIYYTADHYESFTQLY